MKLATALLTALVLAGAATSVSSACPGVDHTTAQNQQDQLLPSKDARS